MRNLSKIIFMTAFLTAFSLAPANVSAAIKFLGDSGSTAGSGAKLPSRPKTCPERGYTLKSCPENKSPRYFCPSNGAYFKSCQCNPKVFAYDRTNCTGTKVLKGRKCDEKFEACECASKYAFSTANCESPKMLSGAQCNGLYESCKCPPKYSYTCSYPLQGSSSECGGKYMSCKCPDSFSTCDDNPDPSAIACREENGVVKYSACHTSVTETCADYGYLTYVPVGQKCKQVKVGNSYCYKDCGYN